MSGEESTGVFEAAVAAAAFAAISSENALSTKQKETRKEPSMKKPTDTGSKFVRWLSSKDAKEDTKLSGDGSFTRSTTTTPDRSTSDKKVNEKAKDKAPSFKRRATFSEETRDRDGSKRFDQVKEEEIQPVPTWDTLGRSRIPGPEPAETKADAWQRAQMEKIRERFERTNATILEWETEKKVKAKRELEWKEREIEAKRLKAQADYREEMNRIDKIVGGAKALTEERKRNDEIKAIEKANKMRSAEQSPKSCCPCF